MRRWNSLSTAAKYVFAATCVAGAFAVTTTATKADGMARGRAPAAMPTSWSGFYFGVQSGYGWADIDSNITVSPLAGNDGVGRDSVTHGSPFVGVHAGVQHQFGSVVLGVEGNWISALRDDFEHRTCPNVTITCGKRFDDILSVGPRIGWAAGHWMPYITGGYANTAISHESFVTVGHTGLFLGRERFDGWYIGGGFEWVVTPGWTVGLEYRHYDFESKTFLTNTTLGALTGDVRTVDPSLDTITVRVSWRWDLPGRAPAAPLK
jgi:outer membrane immunogenic protein